MNRDLLVLFNQELLSPQAIEHEVELLHELLFRVERLDNLVIAHEILDLNKYKVINNSLTLRNTIHKQELKPFIFLNCKNWFQFISLVIFFQSFLFQRLLMNSIP